ncbi:MAG: DUF4105 domain-containing protein [Rhodothermales bacterium]|nr:DUF4105 domain-containing protein [Rhodothermales bacterium]
MVITVIISVLLGLAWLWSLFAIRYFAPVPISVRTPLFLLVAGAPWIIVPTLGWTFALVVTGIVVVPVIVSWIIVKPRNDLDWAPDQERIPAVEFHGDIATIHNLRRATYRSRTDFDVEWYSHSFDLSQLRTAEYVVEPFGKLSAMAHTFVTFGFANGDYLPISIEIRRERPEQFNPVAGIYRQYEIMYVMGDERDLIGLRSNIRKDDVYIYPIRASRARVRRMLEAMLRRADRLNREPEFYNTLVNNCATNILAHLNELEGRRFPFDYRVVAPGWSDRYAYDHGLIDTDLPFEQAKPEFRINERSEFGDSDAREWSRQIRGL